MFQNWCLCRERSKQPAAAEPDTDAQWDWAPACAANNSRRPSSQQAGAQVTTPDHVAARFHAFPSLLLQKHDSKNAVRTFNTWVRLSVAMPCQLTKALAVVRVLHKDLLSL